MIQIRVPSLAALLVTALSWTPSVQAAEANAEARADKLRGRFKTQIAPLLRSHCFACHDADEQEAGIRLDRFDGQLQESSLKLWEVVRDQLASGAMPPEGEDALKQQDLQLLLTWIDDGLNHARARQTERHGTVRRLTVNQYRNTLRELLGTDEDFASELPPDGVNEDGFTGNAEVLLTSPLTIESWFSIAERSLDAVIVDPSSRPEVQCFRMDLGKGINPDPLRESLILGANNLLLDPADYSVTEPTLEKDFPFERKVMKRSFRFHEGYAGNGTVRGWRDFESIYHAVFACMRGDRGYPLGFPYQATEGGLLLRPAIPIGEIPGSSSRYGPKANFKIALRELPETGRFRVRVTASKFDDAMMLSGELRRAMPADVASEAVQLDVDPSAGMSRVEIPEKGIYQVDVYLEAQQPDEKKRSRDLDLRLGRRHFGDTVRHPALMVLRLSQGPLEIEATPRGAGLPAERIVLTQLDQEHPAAQAFEQFERRNPSVSVHVGLRRDCGHTFSAVGEPQEVNAGEAVYEFEGAINNYPRPFVQKDNDNYLAGVREISVRSEYSDDRQFPRLLVKSVEFEGPYYESWPPRSHQMIFPKGRPHSDSAEEAREVISGFASRAFRRPATAGELDALMDIWRDRREEGESFEAAIKSSLITVLTSPQFLFLVEESEGPESEPLGGWELASKLSYFLWNGPPDEPLLEAAADGNLETQLDIQLERMVADRRFSRFADEFVSQWLSVGKLSEVETDRKRYPRLSPHAKRQLAKEPSRFIEHLIRANLGVSELIDSDLVLANGAVAAYYGLDRPEQNVSRFTAVSRAGQPIGGILTQASVLAGLSDGREANPVKRGAWFARKIIAEPPEPPPPNVPELEDTTRLSLRERLERHRSVRGCVKCHEGIDPWGLVLEQYDAGGLFAGEERESASVLPDGTQVADLTEFKRYLLQQRLDDVAFSVARHLATYAIGRSLSYNESRELSQSVGGLASSGYRMGDIMRMVVHSDLFLRK